MRGYCAIGIYHPKKSVNVGGLWRSAHAFGAALIFTIGARYEKRQAADTTYAERHLPYVAYPDWETFQAARPHDARLIVIETPTDGMASCPLPSFTHPERAVYLLGAEDTGLPRNIMERAQAAVHIEGRYCLNVATAGSIVLYDRFAKDGAA